MLTSHADAHGWNWQLDLPDYVTVENSARCPAAALDDMVWAVQSVESAPNDVFAYRSLAQALERNGRVDDALNLLRRTMDRVAAGESNRPEAMHVSFLSEWATRLAVHAGRWEAALEFAEGWKSTSTCGNCASSERTRQTALRARALQALGRSDQVVELARSTVDSSWTRDSTLVELWIDCELASGRAQSAEEGLEAILAQAPEDARATCRRALEDWAVAHASRERQIEDLGRLAESHPELALPLLLSLDASQVTQAMSAFDVVGGRIRHTALAHLLAEIGYPEVEGALGRARGAFEPSVAGSRTKYIQEKFEAGRKRWLLLSGSDR